jgi:type 1 glutamine amidotransferase
MIVKSILLFLVSLWMVSCQAQDTAKAPKSLKVLQIAGGCCHEYEKQMALTSEAFKKNFNCTVDTFVEGKNRTDLHSKLKSENWSEGYDAVLLSLCFGHVKDDKYILSIVEEAAKNKKGLIFLHCSLHNFRSTTEGTNAWRKLMGLSSKGHESKGDLVCENTNPKHPVMKGFPQAHTFPEEEVYIITKVHENAKELARSFGKKTKKFHPVIWTSEYNGCKVFGTSIGHSTVTYKDKVYTDLVSRGLLWTVDGLSPDGVVKNDLKK